MKATIVQPYYSINEKDADRCFEDMLAIMDSITSDTDIIVLPEYCDVPVSTPNGTVFHEMLKKYNPLIDRKVKETAVRCGATVFANYGYKTENGYANATHIIYKNGEEIGVYLKEHPAPSEIKTVKEGGNELDTSYSHVYRKPFTVTVDGVKYAFLTCYDFYMYEYFPVLARLNADVIIGTSHQRTDLHETLETIGKFLTYNTNAYLVRAAVSMGEDSPVCGCSMVVSPKGEMLLNMKNAIGKATVEFDPKEKFYKAAGFQGAKKAHSQYIEVGRRPWLYRNSGSMMVETDKAMKYPRICAHRGFNTVAPENSMAAFGAAIALGAEEIEFDVRRTKDGVLVVSHDNHPERVSDGEGHIKDKTYEELLKLDFGCKYGDKFKGLKITTFEEVLQKFSGTCIMNIHVKIWDDREDDLCFEEIADLLYQYNCEKHCYMMSRNDNALSEFKRRYPEISICVGHDGETKDLLKHAKRAEKIGAEKIQLYKPYFNRETVDYAHAHGIRCTVFWSDDPHEAAEFRNMGIDCILTNDYLTIKNALK